MKKLVAPGQVVIPSNFPRTRSGPDSRGIRICFSELGRSCALKQGFLLFTDGSAYSYDTVSNDVTEALCAQLRRGFVFNRQFRRAGFGFIRGFTPPADYETIYSFPPYGGVTPDACPLPNPIFADLAWVIASNTPGPGQTFDYSLDPGTGDTEVLTASAGVGIANGFSEPTASVTYNGPAALCTCRLETAGNASFTQCAWGFSIFQDGNDIGDFFIINDPNAVQVNPFTIADTGGADSLITLDGIGDLITNTVSGSIVMTARFSSP